MRLRCGCVYFTIYLKPGLYLQGMKFAHRVTQDGYLEILLLVGADLCWRIVQDRIVRGNGPTTVKSKIGYLLFEPLPINWKQIHNSVLNVLTSPHDVADLEKTWKLESVGSLLDEEKDTTNKDSSSTYKTTAIAHSDRKYSVQLPWKHYLPSYKLRHHTDAHLARLSR